tara:strand:- start:1707 stop:2819 length:1113 start_codon:yes stop_codon:yes gene_type:complete
MKTALIFGLGRMGTAIAYSMFKLGFNVHCADKMPTQYRLKGLVDQASFTLLDEDHNIDKLLDTVEPDIVISSMPYHQLWPVAKACIEKGVRYCDLGGRVDISKSINDYGHDKATKPIFTDLGLAPGWVNIVAESMVGYPVNNPDRVEMMVGGIPNKTYSNEANSYNPLDYQVTWSVDGLINEYRDDCIVLKNGKITTVKGMGGLVPVNTILGELEAFYTSGGASHTIHTMHKRGIKNCSYKTLRYPGHRDIVQWLIRKIGLDDDTLTKVFNEGCKAVEDCGDLVIVKVDVYKDDKCVGFEKVVNSDEKFSAMQKCTAFPISSVAALMGEGYFDDRSQQNRGGDVKLPNVLSYSDVTYLLFSGKLSSLLNK